MDWHGWFNGQRQIWFMFDTNIEFGGYFTFDCIERSNKHQPSNYLRFWNSSALLIPESSNFRFLNEVSFRKVRTMRLSVQSISIPGCSLSSLKWLLTFSLIQKSIAINATQGFFRPQLRGVEKKERIENRERSTRSTRRFTVKSDRR